MAETVVMVVVLEMVISGLMCEFLDLMMQMLSQSPATKVGIRPDGSHP
jgi:hypothetical protein